MSKKAAAVFFALFAAFAAFAADGASAAKGEDAISLPSPRKTVKQQSSLEKEDAARTSDAESAAKPAEKKKSAESAAKPAEKKKSIGIAKPAEKKKSAESAAKPATQSGPKNDISLADVTASLGTVTSLFGGMTPMLGAGELLTKEDAVKAFQDLLDAYRRASPEDKQQIVFAVAMMQGVISGISMNAEMFLQQMSPEDREQVVESASAALEIISAVQKELAGKMTDEETAVFGGLFTAFQSLTSAFSKASK